MEALLAVTLWDREVLASCGQRLKMLSNILYSNVRVKKLF
jgi:hypothetical protein